ncbi:MAG: hypothetical protein ACOYMK_16580, partial [Hyphomonadaceae bacterium]
AEIPTVLFHFCSACDLGITDGAPNYVRQDLLDQIRQFGKISGDGPDFDEDDCEKLTPLELLEEGKCDLGSAAIILHIMHDGFRDESIYLGLDLNGGTDGSAHQTLNSRDCLKRLGLEEWARPAL